MVPYTKRLIMVDLWLTTYVYDDYWDICLGLWDSIGCIYICKYIYIHNVGPPFDSQVGS